MESRIVNQDIDLRRTDYRNGFTLYTKVTPRKRKNAIYLAAKTGTAYEDGYPIGTSHLSEHQNVTTRNMKIVERLHGALNAEVARHIVKIIIENTGPRYIPIGINMLYRMIANPERSYEEFLAQITKHDGDPDALGNETDETVDRADDLLYDKMIDTIHRGTPMERSEKVTEDDYLAIKPGVALEYTKRFWVPNNMAMVVVGPIDEEYVQLQVGQTFGRLESKPVNAPDISIPLETPHYAVREERDTKRVNFGVGWRTPLSSAEVGPVLVADYVLDNCAFYQLRCEKAFSYRPKCTFSDHGVSSSLHMELGVKPRRFDEAFDRTLDLVKSVRKDVSPRDLIRARDKLMLELENTLDDPDELASRIVTGHFYPSAYYNPAEMISRIGSVTRRDVLDIFENFITPDKYAMVVLGPISKIPVPSAQQ
ncbi:MAG TPA: insulinase family protein [archaeon]|nr:insulinase family protein [archaeon]